MKQRRRLINVEHPIIFGLSGDAGMVDRAYHLRIRDGGLDDNRARGQRSKSLRRQACKAVRICGDLVKTGHGFKAAYARSAGHAFP